MSSSHCGRRAIAVSPSNIFVAKMIARRNANVLWKTRGHGPTNGYDASDIDMWENTYWLSRPLSGTVLRGRGELKAPVKPAPFFSPAKEGVCGVKGSMTPHTRLTSAVKAKGELPFGPLTGSQTGELRPMKAAARSLAPLRPSLSLIFLNATYTRRDARREATRHPPTAPRVPRVVRGGVRSGRIGGRRRARRTRAPHRRGVSRGSPSRSP